MPLLEVKPVKEFSRDQPCTKVDLWNAFRRGLVFTPRPFGEVRGGVGVNAPKYLRREGYAVMVEKDGIDYLALTDKGRAWLTSGLLRYLELHPEETPKLEQPLPGKMEAKTRAASARMSARTPPNAPVVRRMSRTKRG